MFAEHMGMLPTGSFSCWPGFSAIPCLPDHQQQQLQVSNERMLQVMSSRRPTVNVGLAKAKKHTAST